MDDLIQRFLQRNRNNRLEIHCAGDAMIDEYNMVKVERMSPEHPVPIMKCQNEILRKPGGAANVAYQLRHLNVQTKLFAFRDHDADTVFQNHGLCYVYSNTHPSKLPIKRRYLDNGIQVAPRHDIEFPLCGLTPEQSFDSANYLKTTLKYRSKPNVAILSDYNKGFFASELNILDSYRDVTTIVDPKCGPLKKWRGCTIFKPNAKEAAELTGCNHWGEQAMKLSDELGCRAVVITHGGGMVAGISDGDLFCYNPQKTVPVESVIGAGDCFAAYFAVAIGHGFTPVEAAEIAWTAGSVYVQRRMNRPVVPAELSETKIVHPQDLQSRDFKLVFTNGCFDMLHRGHIETLKFCKSKGDKLVVALNADESIRSFKDPKRPIMPLEHRMAVISSLEYVDFVVSFDEPTPLKVIEMIKPDVLVKGADYEIQNIVGADIVPEVLRAPIVEGVSTTGFIESYVAKL